MKSSVNIQLLLSSPDFKVLSISGEAGDTLESHQVNENALLLVREGVVTYQQAEQSILLSEGEAHAIPADHYHSVRCQEASNIFVVIPKRATMKFERDTQ